jgi:hypothetical protein
LPHEGADPPVRTRPEIIIACDVCHRRGRYHRDRLLTRIGDHVAPEVLRIIAKERRCKIALQSDERRCRAHYTVESLPET